MRAAIVIDNVVENVVIVVPESDWVPPAGTLVVLPDGSPVSIGWSYSGNTFAPPPAPQKTPRSELYPHEFQQLLTIPQKLAIWNTADPTLSLLAIELVTIVSPMPFAPGTQLYQTVQLLGSLLPDLFTPDEVARILSDTPPAA